MRTLQKFCDANSLVLVPIRYRHQFGYVQRKGFDVCKPDGTILISLEPCDMSDAKWYVRHCHDGYNGPRYINRVTPKFLGGIDVDAKSFIRNSVITN